MISCRYDPRMLARRLPSFISTEKMGYLMTTCYGKSLLLYWCIAVPLALQPQEAIAFVPNPTIARCTPITAGSTANACWGKPICRLAATSACNPKFSNIAEGPSPPRASICAGTLNRSRRGPMPNRGSGSRSTSQLHLFDPGAAVMAGTDISAWSVTSATSDLAAELFQASLLPYLAFLWFLKRPETKTPEGGLFGFTFLLVFVLATIPAGIYAKVEYSAILADVDYLHGIAESFLTLTNLFIVTAFRKAVMSEEREKMGGGETVLRSSSAASVLALLAAAPMVLAAGHVEPANALSFPTWMVHVSSLIEWLAAMTYVWRYADVAGMPEWKGLTWGMLPLHTSGLIACTYHIFYNSPELINLVAMQAGLTCFGNTTMAFATWRVWQAGIAKWGKMDGGEVVPVASSDSPSWRDDLPFYGQIFGITAAGAALVKWGELFLDFPFQPSYAAAAALILAPTALNAYKWAERSKDPSAAIEGLL